MRAVLLFLFVLISQLTAAPLSRCILTEEAQPSSALENLLSYLCIPKQTDLNALVSTTQMRWFQKGKERWEFSLIEEDKRPQLIPLLKQIGLIDRIDASALEYDTALIFGGLHCRVVRRVNHLIAQFQRGVRFKQVVLLTGQRYLDHDTFEKDIPLNTETEMMLYVWMNTSMPQELREVPLLIIDTPQQIRADGSLTRPTTQDTLVEWQKNTFEPGRCLFVSDQPFCGYQESVARTCLPAEFSIETIGAESDPDLPIAIYLDNLARWIYQEKIRVYL